MYTIVRRFALFLAISASMAACSRAVSVAPEPGTTYSVLVTNHTGRSVDVSWSDGERWRELGLIAVGGQERFIIAAPRQPTISIRGVSGSRISGPYTITVAAGTTARVTLQ